MTAIDRLRTPPMIVGGIVAGLLLLLIVGIARGAGGVDVADAMQNNVGRAVQGVEVVSIQPASIPAVGAVQTDQHGDRWIWLGRAWVACQHIDPATLAYNSTRTDPANTAWAVLATGDKQKIVEVCR